MPLTCEIVAVGTELLLGQSVDTNSSWIGRQLALNGIHCHYQTRVGDNQLRIASALRIALDRSDVVITCGGLGPTHDDVTREAVAEVMGSELAVDSDSAEWIRQTFEARGRAMTENNLRQALVPIGALPITQRRGTAPGLISPVGEKVIYSVPGVPHEMKEMVERAVLPDLRLRAGSASVIMSRELRTWGESESGLAEMLAPIISRLDREPRATIALLASGVEGLRVRLTTRAPDAGLALEVLTEEENEVRRILGNLVFGVDHQSMEAVIINLCHMRGATLALVESATDGLIMSRLAGVDGAGSVLVGALVPGDGDEGRLRLSELLATDGEDGESDQVDTSSIDAPGLARLAARRFQATIGLATLSPSSAPGGSGPAPEGPKGQGREGPTARTVQVGIHMGERSESMDLRLPNDRHQARELACITALNALRLQLIEL